MSWAPPCPQVRWPDGREPYKRMGVPVNDVPLMGAKRVAVLLKCSRDFHVKYKEVRRTVQVEAVQGGRRLMPLGGGADHCGCWCATLLRGRWSVSLPTILKGF